MLQVFATQPSLTQNKFSREIWAGRGNFSPASGLTANKLKKHKTPLEEQTHDLITAPV